MNKKKPSTYSENVTAMSKIFSKFNYEPLHHDHVDFYYLHRNFYGSEKPAAVMNTEKIILCEINANLWVKALDSATNSITKQTYPHYIIAQNFINYILNTDSTENFGLIENYFWKLFLIHPPNSDMFDYYWKIIFDKFVCLNEKEIEDLPLFFCLIETITDCLKINPRMDGKNDLNEPEIEYNLSAKKSLRVNDFDLQVRCLEVKDSFNAISCKLSGEVVSKKQNSYLKLPWKEKVKRCLIVLNLVYTILETDFIFWLDSKEFKPFEDNRPLIAHLLWKNPRDFGSVNNEVQKLFYLYNLAMDLDFHNVRVIEKFLTLIGEIIRFSDSTKETTYPFAGMNSVNFSRELSLILHQRLIERKNNLNGTELIVNFKPPWLRLFLSSNLLTSITRYPCLPELTGVYDILEYIGNTESTNQQFHKNSIKSDSPNVTTKNVNEILKNGKTHLHLACENNDIEKIKTLLTLPEIDVNTVDKNGWTALHIATHKGKTASVQELLLFCPKAQRPLNTRALGPESTTPIMCAANQGYAKICKLLLEHSGSILLEDTNDFNQTALDLSNTQGVKKVLNYYKSKKTCAKHNYKNINFNLEYKELVIKLCLEMIQAYFSTYRTWDIYKALKKSDKIVKENLNEEELRWYERYDNDISNNICKLKTLLPNLDNVDEFKSLSDIYKRIFFI